MQSVRRNIRALHPAMVKLHQLFTGPKAGFCELAAAILTGPHVMGLFKPDFFRSFAIGFALGAVVVFGTVSGSSGSVFTGGVVPAAIAAPAE